MREWFCSSSTELLGGLSLSFPDVRRQAKILNSTGSYWQSYSPSVFYSMTGISGF
jgi:hypothetical protein